MIPTTLLANRLSKVVAADATTLALPAGCVVVPLSADFSPSPNLVPASVTKAPIVPFFPKVPTPGTQFDSVDPVTGELVIQMIEPVGGWHWNTGVGFAGPVTIYGIGLFNDNYTLLFGTAKYATPIVLTGDNQNLDWPNVEFRIDPTRVH